MGKNLGIVAADPVHIIMDTNFLNEYHELPTDYNVICLMKEEVCPKELYRFVINNDIAVLIITYGVVFNPMENDYEMERFMRKLKFVCTIIEVELIPYECC